MNKINIYNCNANIGDKEYYNKNLNKDKLINFTLILCITLFLIFLFISINTLIILKKVSRLVLILFTLTIFSLMCLHFIKDYYINYKNFNRKYYYLGLPCYSKKNNKVINVNNNYEDFDNDKYIKL